MYSRRHVGIEILRTSQRKTEGTLPSTVVLVNQSIVLKLNRLIETDYIASKIKKKFKASQLILDWWRNPTGKSFEIFPTNHRFVEVLT